MSKEHDAPALAKREPELWSDPHWAHKAAAISEKKARAELRDRFAMAALTGLLAAGDAHAFNRDEMAAEAWRQADAMLKARGHE